MPAVALEAQVATLRSLPALEELPAAEARALASWATFRAFDRGAVVALSHSLNAYCYLILSGSADTIVLDRDGREVSLGMLGAGDQFGISTLFHSRSTLAQVRARETVFALQWPAEKLRDKQSHIPFFMRLLQESYARRRAISTLSRVPLFSQLAIAERIMLAGSLTRYDFERNTVIFEQGSPGQALYLIEQGQIAVEQNGIIVSTLAEGDFFGEMALLSSAAHNATIRTLTPARCLQLPGAAFAELVRQNDALETSLRNVFNQRLDHAERIRHNVIEQQQVQIAVDHGFFRGSHLLVRRPALCPPDCRICEQACADRFGQSRLRLNGVLIDEWDVTTSCRQCRVGAECAEACPEDALQWDASGALRVTDACTGCGDCVPACPYDAVDLMPVRVEERGGPMWMLWRRLQSQPAASAQRLLANKCDLCSGHADHACVSQCPTGSLQLMPVEELFPW
ncbi:MAG TPA: cyclic nucleotide-binding domain-containing protein [Herpetosiphonaceae bacterium]|nr:cyclic nucleotide-binding domain-containing protein [Herpetosiphonaceae bacterium]